MLPRSIIVSDLEHKPTKMAPAFVSAIPCSMHRAFGRQTCVRRPTVYACTQQFDANEGSNSWAQAGKTFELQQMQTIEFVIRPGGLVEETVTGVKGEACEKVRVA